MKPVSEAKKITEIQYSDRAMNIPVFMNTKFNQYDRDVLVYVL